MFMYNYSTYVIGYITLQYTHIYAVTCITPYYPHTCSTLVLCGVHICIVGCVSVKTWSGVYLHAVRCKRSPTWSSACIRGILRTRVCRLYNNLS